MNFWRAAGLNYVQYSSIAARCVRSALKKDLQPVAQKRAETSIKFQKWEAGKPVGAKGNAVKRGEVSLKFQKWDAGKPVTSAQSMAYSFQPLDEALDSLGINYIDGVPVKIADKYKINCDLKEVENIINNTEPKLSCLQSDYDSCFEKKVLQDLEQYQINKTQKLQERKDRIAQFDKRREEEKERIRQEEEKRKLEEQQRIQEEEKRRAEEEEERLREEKLELLRQKEEQERKALEDERIRLLEIERERKKSQIEAEAVTHQEASGNHFKILNSLRFVASVKT